ncbi:filament-like plant protein 3 [Vicia villosa]|uniref:filament-like plant protein 3 n=1 Tax=Vicia villosa TaxID=3911 RepID=UPI00273CD6CC|nr:filament-like plant protein 3 [Vicia villosa]
MKLRMCWQSHIRTWMMKLTLSPSLRFHDYGVDGGPAAKAIRPKFDAFISKVDSHVGFQLPQIDVYATRTATSPKVTSKAPSNEDVVNDVLTLTEKSSAALLDNSSREDLIKQHAKVAAEVVSGWEKAENEVSSLKQGLDAAKQKNVVLEDRVSHLNEELKDCMRKLRQTREEQDQKTHEAVANKSWNQECKSPDLEWKVAELKAQLETAKENAAASVNSGLLQRLEDVERENSCLKIKLQSRLEELEFKIIERLDTECQRLTAMARKKFSANGYKSLTHSSGVNQIM